MVHDLLVVRTPAEQYEQLEALASRKRLLEDTCRARQYCRHFRMLSARCLRNQFITEEKRVFLVIQGLPRFTAELVVFKFFGRDGVQGRVGTG